MSTPLISVITPTKNRLALLREAMNSVEAQTFYAWEHIIVDDGSDEGTAAEVKRRTVTDPRVRYLPRAGQLVGANVCRNQGLAAAAADLIVFLDSDDLLAPDCLERRVAIMERNADIDFAVFQTQVFKNVPGDSNLTFNQELLGDDLLRFLFFETPWIITGPIWRKTTLQRLGGFDEPLLSWQDIDLHIRAVAAPSRYLRFAYADHHIRWQFEETKISVQQRRLPSHLDAAEKLFVKFERVVRDGPGMTWTRQRALCSLYFFVAECWVSRGELGAALEAWQQIRVRALGSRVFHVTGALLLMLQSAGSLGRRLSGRLAHKWKGWMRMRSNPELVAGQK